MGGERGASPLRCDAEGSWASPSSGPTIWWTSQGLAGQRPSTWSPRQQKLLQDGELCLAKCYFDTSWGWSTRLGRLGLLKDPKQKTTTGSKLQGHGFDPELGLLPFVRFMRSSRVCTRFHWVLRFLFLQKIIPEDNLPTINCTWQNECVNVYVLVPWAHTLTWVCSAVQCMTCIHLLIIRNCLVRVTGI